MYDSLVRPYQCTKFPYEMILHASGFLASTLLHGKYKYMVLDEVFVKKENILSEILLGM